MAAPLGAAQYVPNCWRGEPAVWSAGVSANGCQHASIGVCARHTPRPLYACTAALATHSVFGMVLGHLLGVLV